MQSWDQGVELELHGVGSYRTVKSTEDAARALLAHWPRGKGKAYEAAQQACLDALAGKVAPEVARLAFMAAARASRIHIRSTVDPRALAMRGRTGPNNIDGTDSPAFRKANHDVMEAIKKTVARMKAERVSDDRG